MRAANVFLAASFAAISTAFGALVSPLAGSRPNIVLIFLDDLGFEPFADSMIVAPNIQRLATEGMTVHQHMVAHSICSPSRAALLTARLSIRTGVYSGLDPSKIPPGTGDHRVFHPNVWGCLPENETTIAGVLGSAGYDTVAVAKWHLGYSGKPNFTVAECLPTQRGFSSFYGTPYTHCEGPPTSPAVPIYHNLTRTGRLGITAQPSDLIDLYTNFTVDYIKQHAATDAPPFFVYYALDATHEQVYYPERFANSTPRGAFGDAVTASDWSVGQILDAIDDAGIADNTLVVYSGDNGGWKAISPEQSGTTGPFQASWASGQYTGNAAYDTGKGSTWEGGFRLPGLFRWPGTIAAGAHQFEWVSTLDYLPTFAALAGATLPGVKLDGRDVSPLLIGAGAFPLGAFQGLAAAEADGGMDATAALSSHPLGSREYARDVVEQIPFFYYRGPVLQAVRGCGNTSAYKAHFATHSGFGSEPIVWHDPPVVFNLETDIGERSPLNPDAASTKIIVSELTAMVAQHNATLVRGAPQLDSVAYTAMDCQGLNVAQSGCCLKDGGKCAP